MVSDAYQVSVNLFTAKFVRQSVAMTAYVDYYAELAYHFYCGFDWKKDKVGQNRSFFWLREFGKSCLVSLGGFH